MKRPWVVLTTALLSACSLFASKGGTSTTTTPTTSVPSPSPSAVLQGLWVLSPLGIRMHDQPDVNSKVVGGIPQGENLTAREFKGNAPGWYRVTYQGADGWIAAALPDSNPPVPLVTTHPQLSYSSTTAGYYFLYPSSWTVVDKALDAEADAPIPGAPGGATLAPSSTPVNPNGPVVSDKLVIHQAKDIDSLGTVPTRQGSLFDTSTVEVYGITTIRRIYTLASGGVEVDVRFLMAPGRAVLLNFIGVNQKDVDTFNEIMYSFGVNLPGAAPSASP